jgi:hypothetical protein
MNTLEINHYMCRNPITRPYFRGCVAADYLPAIIKNKPCCYIVNNQTSRYPGQHWLAVFFGEDEKTDFMDSFGRTDYIFYDIVKKNSRTICTSPVQAQHVSSNVCGLYCMLFLYYKCQGIDLHQFLCECNRYANDVGIVDLFVKEFQ